MDNLVLIRVAPVLDGRLARGVLREVIEESRQRLRLVFDRPDRSVSVIVSLRPEQPWIGRPVGRWEAPPRHPGPFTTRLIRELRGARVTGLEKASSDRSVALRFAGGRSLVAELATHGANLVLLDPSGKVEASARKPRSAATRLAPGAAYVPAPLPGRLLDPLDRDAGEIDRFVSRVMAEGETLFEALRRRVFGVGSEGARLVVEECATSGRSAGEVLAERLRLLAAGELDPVIEAPEDPLEAARRGRLDPERVSLLPWEPAGGPREGRRLIRAADAAATAAVHYEAAERLAVAERRRAALGAILDREVERLHQAERAAAADLGRFEEPERYRRWGEALLAGLGRAERVEGNVLVPDPYDPEQRPLVIPDRPGVDLKTLANDLFARHRRAERGAGRARQRQERLRARRARLDVLADRFEMAGPEAMVALEREMREAGIPVSLERPTKTARAAARLMPLRLEGVRLFVSREGHSILAGRSGKDNHRLTFKLAGPEDFWFHALGCAGAHVVVRNEERRRRPPPATLEQAAAVAAWFSEARSQGAVDVQWTRRKYVRRPRGAPPGTVVLKRFETVRVRPALPPEA